MFNSFLAKLFNVSKEAVEFVRDNKKRYVQRLLIILPLTAWATIFYQVNPLFIKWQIDSLTQGWTRIGVYEFNQVIIVFALIIGLYLLLNLLDKFFLFLKNIVILRLNQDTEGFLEDKFTNFLTKFDGAFLSSENNLRLIRNLQWRLSDIEKKFTELLQKVIESGLGIFALILVLPLIHPYLLIIIITSVVVDLLIDYVQNQNWRQFELLEARQSEQRNEIKWRLIWYFNQILSNNWLTQINRVYTQRRNDFFKTQFRQQRLDQNFSLAKDISNLLVYSLASLVGGYLVINKQIEIGTFVIFGLYIDRLKSQVQSIGSVFRTIFELRFELFRFDFLMHIKPKLDYSNIQKFESSSVFKITIQNLSFQYPQFFQEELDYLQMMQKRVGILKDIDDKNPLTQNISEAKKNKQNWFQKIYNKIVHQSISVWNRNRLNDEFKELEKMFEKAGENKMILENLNLELEQGKIYAIVGYNGAGKTTLTRLLKRSVDPTSGDIFLHYTIPGKSGKTKSFVPNMKNIDPLVWRKNLASLEQQSFLWDSLSVRDNLLLGLDSKESKIDDKKLFEVIEKVGLGDIVKDLDAIIGEGLELSGGQAQLLEIARVYLQKKPIVILDEGTNQLDAVRENQILELLQEIKKTSIVIFITHRMTTCHKCDEVVILENGKLAVKGSPVDLLKSTKPNLYKKFWRLQVIGGQTGLGENNKE